MKKCLKKEETDKAWANYHSLDNQPMQNDSWLALETSTDVLSLAVARGSQVWSHSSAGGAKSSEQTLPQVLRLMQEADLAFSQLQAVVFGRGPGAFTGLRTACSVAQGLAFGAGLKVLPIDTLLAVADDARQQLQDEHANHTTHAHADINNATDVVTRVLTIVDARMDQVYVAAYEHASTGWRCVQDAEVLHPEALHWPADWAEQHFVAAGNAWHMYAGRWPATLKVMQLEAMPTAQALLRLAPQAWRDGMAVAPEDALPLYIRDKVAQTTAERAQATMST
jgi:tRNA threonylcarbamoyladenosine biosynthesis protein TsaB